MKKILTLLVMLLLLSCGAAQAAVNPGLINNPNITRPTGGIAEIDVYSVTDFKGHVIDEVGSQGAVRLSGMLQSMRLGNPFGSIFLGGANMLMGNIFNDQENGQPTVLMMNSIPMTADVVSKTAFTVSPEVLKSQTRRAYFSTLGANVLDAEGNVAKPFKPSLILSRSGVAVGVIGLASSRIAAEVPQENIAGYNIVPPESVAQKQIDEVRAAGAQVVVLVTSLEADTDREGNITGEVTTLLDNVQGVDAVFAGGNGRQITGNYKGMPVVQAGENGQAVGRIRVYYDRTEKKVQEHEATIYRVEEMPITIDLALARNLDKTMKGHDFEKTATSIGERTPLAPKMLNKVYNVKPNLDNTFNNTTDNSWNRPEAQQFKPTKGPKAIPEGDFVAITQYMLINDPKGHSHVADAFNDIIRKAFHADVVLYDAESYRIGFPAGDITTKGLEKLLGGKKGQHIVVGNLSGRDIRAALENGLVKGDIIRYSGLIVAADFKAKEGSRIVKVSMDDGTPLQDDKLYKVVTNSAMLKGRGGYDSVKKLQGASDMGEQYDFFLYALKNVRHLYFNGDNRLQY